MIQMAYIINWRETAPWESDAQVEQDLILSRIIADIYADPFLSEKLAFRGGTALQKLFYKTPTRYSEDIDLVQIKAEPIGETINHLRELLDPWLGNPEWKQNEGRFTLVYRFTTETQPVTRMRVKIEINTREHFAVLGFQSVPFQLESPWHSKSVAVTSYQLEELLGTKLRALHQRKKGRDLFDLNRALENFPDLNIKSIVDCFQHYIQVTDKKVTRAEFERNMSMKIRESRFTQDIAPLLSFTARQTYQPEQAYEQVMARIISKIGGEAWKRPA